MKLKTPLCLTLVLSGGLFGCSAVAQPVAPLTWSVQNGSLLVNSERRRDFSYAYQLQSAPDAAGPWSASGASEVILSEDDTNWLVQSSIPMTAARSCHRADENRPEVSDSKPATLK